MSLNEIFKRLLGSKDHAPTCSKLVRTDKYKEAYAQWLAAQEYLHWTGPYFKAYHYKKCGLPAGLRVQLLQEEHFSGAVFFYDPGIGSQNFSFLFDLFKDRVLQHGYSLHSCDRLEVRHERYTEQVEKHLLTPPASDLPGSSLCNQLYGNILLDFIRVNKHPGYIRFAANTYNDSYFSKPLPFEELLEKVLQPKEKRTF